MGQAGRNNRLRRSHAHGEDAHQGRLGRYTDRQVQRVQHGPRRLLSGPWRWETRGCPHLRGGGAFMSGYRILVVDEKRDLAQGAAPILHKLSDNIAVAYSAEEAIEMLDRCPADVVLSDVRMPGRDGVPFFDVARERWPATRVILFAANGTVDSAVKAVKCGAFDYVTRPIDNDELLAVTGRA